MKIFIVNGNPESGKTYFEDKMIESIGRDKATKLSIIDPIKSILSKSGIDINNKTNKTRRLLYEVKCAMNEYNDYCFNELKKEINICKNQGIEYIFCDMREYEDIERARRLWNAIVIKVERSVSEINTSNPADSGVDNITYDMIIKNDGNENNMNDIVYSIRKEYGI